MSNTSRSTPENRNRDSSSETSGKPREWEQVTEYAARELLRVFIPSTAVCSCIAVVLSIVPSFYPERLIVGCAFGSTILLPWIHYRRGDVFKGLTYLLTSLFAVCVGGVLFSGGIFEPAYIALLALLVMSAWFVSTRFVIWFIVGFLGLGLFTTQLMHAGVIAPKELPDGTWYAGVLTTLAIVMGFTLVTVRTLLRNALQNAERKSTILNSVFAAIDDTFVLLDSNLAVVPVDESVSPAPVELCGLSFEQLLDHSTESPVDTQCSVREFLKTVAPGTSPRRVTSQITTAHEGKRFIEITAASVNPCSHLQRPGIAVLLRDVSDETHRRELLARSQRMEAIGKLASGIAHDFNNILTGIKSSASFLLEDAPPDRAELLGIIVNSSDRAALLTQRLLVHGEGRRGASNPALDVTDMLSESIGLLENTLDRRVRLVAELPADAIHVNVDAALLQGVFLNLAINAAQAMPDGGKIVFRASTITAQQALAQRVHEALDPGTYAMVEVEDNGPGIPLELQSRIFEPFFTTKSRGEGTGLGLSNTYESLHQSGGGIAVQSTPGSGSKFSVFLPLMTEEIVKPARDRDPVSQTRVSPGSRVMIVDDEFGVRRSLQIALVARGYVVESFEQGAKALEALSQTSFDVVLLDMLMPGMTGREVFNEIQKLAAPPPVIITTGFAEVEDLKFMRAQGLFGVVSKPYHMATIVEQLERAHALREPDKSSNNVALADELRDVVSRSVDAQDPRRPSTRPRPPAAG